MLPHSPSYQMGFYPPVWWLLTYSANAHQPKLVCDIGAACEATGAVVLFVDYHRGSEENSPTGSTTNPTWWTPRTGASTRCRTGAGPPRASDSRRRSSASRGTPPSSQPAGTGRLPSALSTAGTRRSRPGPTTAAGRLTSPSVACSASTTCCRTQRTGAVPPVSSNVLRSSPPSSSTTTPARAAPGAGHAGNPALDGIHSAVVEWGPGAPLHYCVVETFASMSGRVGVVSGQPRGRWHGAAVARACPDGPQR